MKKDLLPILCSIIPCNVENILDYHIENNRLTLFTAETKYTLICYEKK